MLISKRRMQSSAILFLIVLVAVLFRPVRSWIDQAFVRHVISPRLHVSEMTYHSQSSVIEARRIAWTSQRGPHVYQLKASRAWVAIEQEPLLARSISIPHVLVENAEISLRNYSPAAAQQPVSWQQQLAKRVAQLDWEQIQRGFTSLLAAQDVNATWEQRISRWVLRSTEIVRQVELLDAQSDLTNPLRFEDQIKSKLSLIDELTTEQQLLANQFSNLEKLLTAEDNRLRNLFQQELQQLHPQDTIEQQQIIHSVSNALLLDAASILWLTYSPHAKIADVVATEMLPNASGPSYDRDFGTHAVPVCVSDLEVKGDLLQDDCRIPFLLSANYKMARQPDSSSIATGHWDFRFKADPSTITVAASRIAAFPGLHFLMQVYDNDASAFASPSDRQVDIHPPEGSPCSLELEFDSADEQIAGQMHVDLARIAGLSEQFHNVLHQACRDQPACRITVDIHGTWQEPRFSLPEAAPEFLANSLRRFQDERILAANTELEMQLTEQFESELQTMDRLVHRAADAGLSIIQDHSQQVAGVRQALLENLDEISGTAFARRPHQPKTR